MSLLIDSTADHQKWSRPAPARACWSVIGYSNGLIPAAFYIDATERRQASLTSRDTLCYCTGVSSYPAIPKRQYIRSPS